MHWLGQKLTGEDVRSEGHLAALPHCDQCPRYQRETRVVCGDTKMDQITIRHHSESRTLMF